MVKFLEVIVKGRLNVLISGGTGSGKTTLLNMVSKFIPNNERIVTIEDAAELRPQQDHVVSMETRPATKDGLVEINQRDLVRNALRMRPDRIIVGEVRGAEVLDMLQAMNTGHDGSLTTIHANAPRDAMGRMEMMMLYGGITLPHIAMLKTIVSAINVIVQLTRFNDGIRRISYITEITGMEGEVVTMSDIAKFEQEGYDSDGRVKGRFVVSRVPPKFMDLLRARGVT